MLKLILVLNGAFENIKYMELCMAENIFDIELMQKKFLRLTMLYKTINFYKLTLNFAEELAQRLSML